MIVADACDDTDCRCVYEKIGGIIFSADADLQKQHIHSSLFSVGYDE